MGWGQALRQQLRGRSEVLNLAAPGFGTRRFDSERWSGVQRAMRAGSLLLMQFGHIDALPDVQQHAPAEGLYREMLQRFVERARSAGAHPVLVTPVATYGFMHGKIQGIHADYAQAVRSLARQTATPLIDLAILSSMTMEREGEERVRAWFMVTHDGKDKVHLTTTGAFAIAKLVQEALVHQGILR